MTIIHTNSGDVQEGSGGKREWGEGLITFFGRSVLLRKTIDKGDISENIPCPTLKVHSTVF